MVETTLQDKIAIVTGGSSGIDSAIVDELLKAGTKVVNADINNREECITGIVIHCFYCAMDV